MANETQNSKSSPLLPCEFLLLRITGKGQPEAATKPTRLARPAVCGSNGSAVTVAQEVDGNRLPEKMVCEHELTVGQAGEDVSLLLRTLEYDFLEI